MFLKVHTLNNRAESFASKYMKQKQIELQGEIDKSTIISRYFNIILSIVDKRSRQKTC